MTGARPPAAPPAAASLPRQALFRFDGPSRSWIVERKRNRANAFEPPWLGRGPAPYSERMSQTTIADGERDRIRAALHDLAGPVTLHYYTSDVDSWYSRSERALLEEIRGASPRIALEIHADRWDAAREAAVGIARTPVLAVAGARDTGVRYYGVPDGYELDVF